MIAKLHLFFAILGLLVGFITLIFMYYSSFDIFGIVIVLLNWSAGLFNLAIFIRFNEKGGKTKNGNAKRRINCI